MGQQFEGVSDARRRIMRSVRRRDTGAEMQLRRELHRLGLRYRVDFALRPDDGRPVRPDVVFRRERLAVFVDGCFWHCCPEHASVPMANAGYWAEKLRRNRERDALTNERLLSAGWDVLRFWEHEDLLQAAGVVADAVNTRRRAP